MSLDQRSYTVWLVCALLYCRTLQFPSVSRKKVMIASQPLSRPLQKYTTINKIEATSKNTIILSNCGLCRDSCKPDFQIIVCSSHKLHVQWPVFKITIVFIMHNYSGLFLLASLCEPAHCSVQYLEKANICRM